MGRQGLAYKIKKNRKAHFSLLNIDAPPAAVAEMERRMGLSTEIIRFLTVKVEQHETEPSAMMRKSDRDERGDRGDRGFGGRGGPAVAVAASAAIAMAVAAAAVSVAIAIAVRAGEREGSTFRARPPRDGDRPPRDGDRPPRPPRETRDTPAAAPAPSTDRNSNSES